MIAEMRVELLEGKNDVGRQIIDPWPGINKFFKERGNTHL